MSRFYITGKGYGGQAENESRRILEIGAGTQLPETNIRTSPPDLPQGRLPAGGREGHLHFGGVPPG
ncbi:MAG TPA: hypothetical protein PLF36_08305, partial [Syntrophales bacterium]|nr:hypothetical protein [Syntrophales bacterium]HQJ29954.1 hypothetical protein [Syntrophales bacterium]